MQTTMAQLFRVLVVSSALCVPMAHAAEPDAPPAADATATPASSAPPGISEAQRKNLLLANIPLGKDEGDGFWPLFRDYRRDILKLQDQRAKVVAGIRGDLPLDDGRSGQGDGRELSCGR